jgi:hypothetical protein
MKTAKIRPTAAPTVALTLTVGDTAYAIRPIACTEHEDVAWRVTKPDGTAYEIGRSHLTGWCICSCPDFLWKHADAGLGDPGCKHIRALRSLGLL